MIREDSNLITPPKFYLDVSKIMRKVLHLGLKGGELILDLNECLEIISLTPSLIHTRRLSIVV